MQTKIRVFKDRTGNALMPYVLSKDGRHDLFNHFSVVWLIGLLVIRRCLHIPFKRNFLKSEGQSDGINAIAYEQKSLM